MARTITVKTEIIPIRLEDAIQEFMTFKPRSGKGGSVSTMKAYKTTLQRLLGAAGNIWVYELNRRHVGDVLSVNDGGCQGTLNHKISHMTQFVLWAQNGQYFPPGPGPVKANYFTTPYESEKISPIPATEWPKLLGFAAERHPGDRAYVALGLWSCGRGPSEIGRMRVMDMDPRAWTFDLSRPKVKMTRSDKITMQAPLRREMARWLTWYSDWAMREMGTPLQPSWYLIPRMMYRPQGGPYDPAKWWIDPREGRGNLHVIARTALQRYGCQVTHPDGTYNKRYGSHALRYIGARALFDALLEIEGYDGALRTVQTLLGHKTQTMTENYLGTDVDRHRRNEVLPRLAYGETVRTVFDDLAEEDGMALEEAESAVQALPCFQGLRIA